METFLEGIEPEHATAFVAGLLALIVIPFLNGLAAARGGDADLDAGHFPAGTEARRPRPWIAGGPSSIVDRWAAALLGYAAAVHLFLPLGHPGSPNTLAYLASGVAFGFLAFQAFRGRRWRLGTAVLAPATVIGYLIWGGDPDQVGIFTALLELTAFGLAVATMQRAGVTRIRVWGSIGTVFAVVLGGAIMWIASFQAHQATNADAASPSVGHQSRGGHEHLVRAQAGVIMRPLGRDARATAEETAAAIALSKATSTAMSRYARLQDAIAAGYKCGLGGCKGMDAHLEHEEYKKDGRLLDPERPEQLVFAIEDGKATLLGVVYVMERAGEPGQAPGGPITRWHAHNLCISLMPPGIGIVTPYGGCPSVSVQITIPEMMHVWIVEPPGGPYAEGVDQNWAREYHRKHGLAIGLRP